MFAKLLVPLLFAAAARAQDPEVRICNVSVKIGMAKTDVLAQFATNSSMKIERSPDYPNVKPAIQGYQFAPMDGASCVENGSLVFDEDKLVLIRAGRFFTSDKAERLAKALYSQLAGDGDSSVIVRTFRNDSAENPLYNLSFVLPDRKISLSIMTIEGRETLRLDRAYGRGAK